MINTEDCWLWARYIDPRRGYGGLKYLVGNKYRTITAHRFVYMHLVGDIPEGLEIDHLCRVRACVNPEHLEAVDHLENVRRSAGVPRVRKHPLKTHCKNGHQLSEGDYYTKVNRQNPSKTWRQCKTCVVDNNRKYRKLRRIYL